MKTVQNIRFLNVALAIAINEIVEKGFSLLPRNFTLETYKFIFENKGKMLLRAYGMSFAATILGTVISTSIMSLYAYAASQKKTVFDLLECCRFLPGLQ